MRLKYKLLTSYLVIAVLALVLCLLGLNGYRIVHSHFMAVTQDILPGQQAMMSAKQSTLEMIVESRDYLRTGDETLAQYAREGMDDLRESLRIHLEHETHVGEAERGVAEEMERRGLHLIDLCNDLIDAYQRGDSKETLSQGREEIRLCKDELFELLDEHLAVHEQELLDAQNGIYQTIVRGFWTFLVGSILILAMGLTTAFYTANAIVGPIHELEAGADIIGGGDLSHRLDIRTGDEVERLAVAFNEMAARLADIVDTLEQRVAARTSELTTTNEQLESEIVERKRAEEALRRRADEMVALQATVLDITTSHDLPTLLQTIVERAARLLNALGGGLYLCDPDREQVRCVVSYNTPRDFTGIVLKYGEGAAGTVAQTGEPLIIDDYRIWPGRAGVYEEEQPFTAILSAPMIWQGQVTGVIHVLHDVESRRFSQADLELLALFANHAAIAVENTRLYEQSQREITERKRAEESLRESEERLHRVVENMPVMMDAFDADGNILVWNQECERVTGFSADEIIGNPRAPELLFPDAAYRERMMAEWDRLGDDHRGWEWEMACQDGSVKTVAWSNVSAQFPIPGWASWGVGVDITERKQAEEMLRQRTAQLEMLREMGLEIVSQLDLDALLHSITARAVELLGGISGGIYLYRPERELLEWAVSVGHPALVGVTLRRGEGLAGKVWESGAAMTVDDYRRWEGRAVSYDEFDFASTVGAPIHWGTEFLGVLNVNGDPTRTFSPADAELLSLFATQAASAIRNARLLQAEQEQRELAEALEKAAAAVNSTLDLDEVLDRILEQVERVVPGCAFNIMRIEGEHARTVRWRGQKRFGAEEFISTVAFRISEVPTLQRMVETGKPVIIPDTSADPNWVALPELEWLRSYVAAPIQVGGVAVGFLNVDGARPGRFGPADARRLEAFASHAAAAIENARLYQELQSHAGQLERRVQERTAELEAQYAWLDAILDSATDGVIVTDEEGSIVRANPVAQAWLAQTLSPEEAARLREAVRDLARQAEEQPETILELTGLDLELNVAPVASPSPSLHASGGAVIDIHDVTHLKSLERMRNRFVTNVSHELRTPITTIKLYAYLMQQHPEKWEQYLDTLVWEADHQAQLVEDILQISRIDAGRLEMKPCPTPLDELAQAVILNRRAPAQEKGLTLEYRPAPQVGEAVALVDPDRMTQVLNNLVENAIHYTPEGGSVTLSTGTEEAQGRVWATVTVADTGIGIPEEELLHVFDRFFRGVEPRSMQISGTGLGLAIVKEIVELHGGWVTVESQVDVGSAFTVWLPLSDQDETARGGEK